MCAGCTLAPWRAIFCHLWASLLRGAQGQGESKLWSVALAGSVGAVMPAVMKPLKDSNGRG